MGRGEIAKRNEQDGERDCVCEVNMGENKSERKKETDKY